jgi:hypothetical protein
MTVGGQPRSPAVLPPGEVPQIPTEWDYVGPTVGLDVSQKTNLLTLPRIDRGL